MNDQDKMFAEIPSPTSGEDAASPLEKDAASSLEKEELQKRGAKIFACNERSRARIAEIAHLANECLLNTNHPNGYEQGQYGKDYRTYGKAMGEIRKLVKESIADVDPDYEMLALQFARKTFDFSKFKEALAAVASMKPTDFPGVYYTPDWLVRFAKEHLENKGEAASSPLVEKAEIPSPTSGEDAASPLAVADKAAKHEEFHRRHWTFCNGLFPISFVVTEEGFMERCTINGRRFKASVIQEEQYNAMTWNGYIYDNGKCVCMVSGMGKGKRVVMDMTHAAFKAYVRCLSGTGGGKYHNKGGFLKLNAKRALAARSELENGGRA